MTTPGIITGSTTAERLFRTTDMSSEARTRQGVFSPNPGATPKFARNNGRRDAEYQETMARLFVAIPSGELNAFLNSVSTEARPVAQVLTAWGSSGGTGGTGFVDFLLTSATESFSEKAQIVDTLTDNYVAFYSGQAPALFQYSGVVLNTYQDDQRVWLLQLYREILRGTRLANRNIIANLRYDSFLVSGYLENLQLSITGETDNSAGNFTFSLRVKRMSLITPMLAYPTTLETPAVNNTIFADVATNPYTADTERVAVVTPDVPPTANEAPAAGPGSQAPSTATTQALAAAGLSTTQVNSAYARSSAAAAAAGDTQTPEVQAREQAFLATSQGTRRIGETVTGGTSTSTVTVPVAQGITRAETQASISRILEEAGLSRGETSSLLQTGHTGSTGTAASVVDTYAAQAAALQPIYNSDGLLVGYNLDNLPANPGNVSNDGNGGLTNVAGELSTSNGTTPPVLSTDSTVPLTRRSGERSRGRTRGLGASTP